MSMFVSVKLVCRRLRGVCLIRQDCGAVGEDITGVSGRTLHRVLHS